MFLSRQFAPRAALVALLGLLIGCADQSSSPESSQARNSSTATPKEGDTPEADAGERDPVSGDTAGEHEPEGTPPESEAPQTSGTSNVSTAAPPDAPARSSQVMLGADADLYAGIPGEGPLTDAQIQAWLDDPANHAELEVVLPQGLDLGAGQIQGLEDNPLTRAKIELGRQLYFDKRLSADSTVSCATCHEPDHGYAADTQFGVGIGGQTGNRNSPVAYNRIFSDKQFWDGRADSLEAQAIGPVANPIEMGNTHEACEARVRGIQAYRLQFDKIFSDGVTIENVGKAIASFERAIVTGPSPWDYWDALHKLEEAYAADLEDLDALRDEDPDSYQELTTELAGLKAASDAHPISESAKRGGELFFGQRAGCTACHVGANFTDEKYHNLGVGMDTQEPDLGRYVVSQDEKDKGAFKTPTIRNVELTPPYMHDGSQQTLAEVVEWYAKGGHPNPHLSKDIKKLDLSDQDKMDLVEFMKALTGPLPTVERERLPQ